MSPRYTLIFLALSLFCLPPLPARALTVGMGWYNGDCSTAAALEAGGKAAAEQAKVALKDKPAKLVLVFDCSDLTFDPRFEKMTAMIKGITSVFDAQIVYGCSGYGAITATRDYALAVLALAGDDLTVAAAMTPVDKGQYAAQQPVGKTLGETLKPAYDAAVKKRGRLLLLFGACHVDANNRLIEGVKSVLGEDCPITGGSANRMMMEGIYFEGKVQPSLTDVGVLLSGDFTCNFALVGDNTSAETVLKTATQAFEQVSGADKSRNQLYLVFGCPTRAQTLTKENVAPVKEREAMKAVAGDVPIFGLVGSGENGKVDNRTPAKGVGSSLAVVAISQ